MDDIKEFLGLIGVIVGWLLKSLSDWLRDIALRTKEINKATFYFLRAFKTLLDYERFLRNLRSNNPSVQDFAPHQVIIWERFVRRSELETDCYFQAVEALSSIDPALAIRADNTLKNLLDHFKNAPFMDVADENPELYKQLLYVHDELVDFTLSDLAMVTKKLSARSGLLARFRVWKWFREREQGEKDVSTVISEMAPSLGITPEEEPEVRNEGQNPARSEEIGLHTSIPWYENADDFAAILQMIPATESRNAVTYQAWVHSIVEAEKTLIMRGMIPIRISVKPEKLGAWAGNKSLPLCRQTIAQYAMEKLALQVLHRAQKEMKAKSASCPGNLGIEPLHEANAAQPVSADGKSNLKGV